MQQQDGFASVGSGVELLGRLLRPLGREPVYLQSAVDRTLAEDVVASVDVPAFDRSAMDGYGVRANDTKDATADNPVILTVKGNSLPGRPFVGTVEAGEAVRIMTGAPIPAGANAVVPLETIDELPDGERKRFAISALVCEGKNVGQKGEDIRRGQTLFQFGRILRLQDVGVLASIGFSPVRVLRRLRVTVLPGVSLSSASKCCPILIASMLREESLTPTIVGCESMYDPCFRLAPTELLISVGTEDGGDASAKDCQIGVAEDIPIVAFPSNPWGCLYSFRQVLVPAIRALGLRSLRSVQNLKREKR